jgi:hypothetical protein
MQLEIIQDAQRVSSSEKNEHISAIKLRIADLYYPTGKKRRILFKVNQLEIDGRVWKIWLLAENEIIKVIDCPTDLKSAVKTLQTILHSQLVQIGEQIAFVDSQMTLRDWPEGVMAATFQVGNWFPHRYVYYKNSWKIIERYMDLCWDEFWQDRDAYLQKIQAKEMTWREN